MNSCLSQIENSHEDFEKQIYYLGPEREVEHIREEAKKRSQDGE